MRLHQLRTERNITLKTLAEHLGVTVRTITNYENGSREPNIATIIALADYFGVTTDYLLGRTEKV